MSAQPLDSPSRNERILLFFLLASLSSFIAWGFHPEIFAGKTQFSDVTLHLSILQQLDQVVRAGGSAFDFWFDASPFGFALFRSYQHLPHLIMYGAYRVGGGLLDLPTILSLFTLILACALPWSFYWAARVLGFSCWAAVSSALFSPCLSEEGGYGLSLANYTWGTYGIITQLWAVVFLAPAIAYTIKFLRTGKGIATYVALCFMAVGSHILAAYILIGTLLLTLIYLLPQSKLEKKLLLNRTTLALGAFLAVTAHQWVFILLDRSLVHRGTFEPDWKFSSHGINWVWSNFISGALFDNTSAPIVTAFLLIGCAAIISKLYTADSDSKTSAEINSNTKILLLGLFIWLTLLCGYEIWGWLFQSLPLLSAMPLHRFIVPVQISGLLLAGYGLGLILHQIPSVYIKTLMLCSLLAIPLERPFEGFQRSHDFIERVQKANFKDSATADLITTIKKLPRSWVYLGMSSTWADQLMIADLSHYYHPVTAEGLPTLGMLFHSMSIAGDVLFDFNPLREQDYQTFGVKYCVSPISWKQPDFLKTIKEFKTFRLSEFSKAQMLSVEDLSFEGWGSSKDSVRFFQAWFNSSLPERHAYGKISDGKVSGELFSVPFASHSLNVPIQDHAPGELIEESTWQNHKITGTVQAHRKSIVVFRTGYHPNWRATVDGINRKVMQVTPGFLAVEIEPGHHQITFEYVPSRLKPWLLFLAIAGIGGLIARNFKMNLI